MLYVKCANLPRNPWKSIEKVMFTRSLLLVKTGLSIHHLLCAKLKVMIMITSLITLSAAQGPELARSVCYFLWMHVYLFCI